MRFALFCDDPSAQPLIDVLNDRADGHSLAYAVRITPKCDELLHACQGVSFLEHWEDLLVAKDVDAVIVGGSDPSILEGAKQLATANLPILFLPSSAQGSTFAYEMSLIRDDNRVVLFPTFNHRFDAAAIELRSIVRRGDLGRIQFLQLQRSLSRPTAGMPISQVDVDAELLSDIDLPRWLLGDYNQVTALQTAATTDGVMMQTVVLAGRSLPEVNWSVCPVVGPGEWKLTVRGETGTAELVRDPSGRHWICSINGQRTEGNEQASARNLITDFAETLKQSRQSGGSHNSNGIEWGELIKCFEVIDASHRSVTRRRTIELHFEAMSERAIFKTQMTAIGCGLLVATFLLSLCYLGVASIVPLPPRVLIGMRAIVFLPLGIFLIAQLLLPLTRPTSREATGS